MYMLLYFGCCNNYIIVWCVFKHVYDDRGRCSYNHSLHISESKVYSIVHAVHVDLAVYILHVCTVSRWFYIPLHACMVQEWLNTITQYRKWLPEASCRARGVRVQEVCAHIGKNT